MKKLPFIARMLLGLIFFVFGLNGFLHFLPTPPMSGRPAEFMAGMAATKYFFPFLKGTETICGALLLVGAFVPLALVVLAPIVINIILFHTFLAPSGLPLALTIGVLLAYLAFFAKPYSAIVKQIFRCPMKEAMDRKKG